MGTCYFLITLRAVFSAHNHRLVNTFLFHIYKWMYTFQHFYYFREWGVGKVKEFISLSEASQVALEVKNLPANAGDISKMDLIPGSRRPSGGGHGYTLQYSLEKEIATYSSILAWRIPWTEDPDGPWSMGLQKLDVT